MRDLIKFVIIGGVFALVGGAVGQFFGPLGMVVGGVLGFACVWLLP